MNYLRIQNMDFNSRILKNAQLAKQNPVIKVTLNIVV
jgi:hypothetical protein